MNTSIRGLLAACRGESRASIGLHRPPSASIGRTQTRPRAARAVGLERIRPPMARPSAEISQRTRMDETRMGSDCSHSAVRAVGPERIRPPTARPSAVNRPRAVAPRRGPAVGRRWPAAAAIQATCRRAAKIGLGWLRLGWTRLGWTRMDSAWACRGCAPATRPRTRPPERRRGPEEASLVVRDERYGTEFTKSVVTGSPSLVAARRCNTSREASLVAALSLGCRQAASACIASWVRALTVASLVAARCGESQSR